MANESIAFSIKIDGVDREIKSLKDLKQAKKDATDAFLRGDKDAAKAIADLKDKTEDLTDATQTLKGSGVEKLNGSFSQLRDGFANFDTDKIKTGFKGIGSAMSAIPIFLLIEGLKYLWENFDKVSAAVKNFFNITSDAEKNIKQLEASVNSLREANSLLITSLENEVKILEAQGGSQAKLLELRKRIIAEKIKEAEADVLLQKAKIAEILANDSLIESYYRVGAANARRFGQDKEAAAFDALLAKEKGDRIKESTDLLKADLITINNLKTDAQVADIKRENEITANYKKNADERKNIERERLNQSQQWFDELNNREKAALNQRQLDEVAAYENKKLLDIQIQEEKDKRDADARAKKRKQDEEDLAAAKKLKQDEQDFAFNVTNKSIQAAQSITDAYFAYKLNGVKKGSAEELKIAKQQFETNKKLQLAQATIQGIQSVLAAFSSGSAIPVIGAVAGPAYAVLAGITAAANIAKIASTKFDGGGLGATTTSGSTSLPNVPAPPTINTPGANTSSATTFDENGQRIGGNETERVMNPTINVKATVVETEMTETQKRVSALETQSKF